MKLKEKFLYKNDTDVSVEPNSQLGRQIEGVVIGPRAEGITRPHPDTSDALTRALGVAYRVAKIVPKPRSELFYAEFEEFVGNWIKQRKIQPLSPDHDLSVETWLTKINQPKWRKDQLEALHNKVYDRFRRGKGRNINRLVHFGVNVFTKDEAYDDYKHARGIYARSDDAKVEFGPFFHAIEEVLYEQAEFIKHCPVRDRAKYIYEHLYRLDGEYVATDYSSYEAHFSRELMLSCEFVLYKHMAKLLPNRHHILGTLATVLLNVNFCKSRGLTADITACRMSGEMNTSLGNGFTNLMLMSFLCYKKGIVCNGVVEGDDGLFVFPRGRSPSTKDFADMGCLIKLEVHQDVSTASFCGLIFDPTDLQVITNPLKVLASTPWSYKRYAHSRPSKKLGLLRAKALSLLYQYPACPIITAYARYLARMTRGVDPRRSIHQERNWWEYQQLTAAYFNLDLKEDQSVSLGTRAVFERQFGVSIAAQLEIEEFFSTKCDLLPFHLPQLDPLIPEAWKHYDTYYVLEVPQDGRTRVELPWIGVAEPLFHDIAKREEVVDLEEELFFRRW